MEWMSLDFPGLSPESPNRQLLETKVAGKRLCLAHHGGKWHAIDGRCPHAGGPLADGHLDEEGHVVCPWHRFAYDLKSGQSDSGGYYVNTYPVRVKRGHLQVQIDPRKPWWKFW
jgi:nitrite reductase/ring-hydroxylating ferredoxin subunit